MRAGRLIACLPALFVGAASASAQEVTSARYTDPTTRYGHGVLGPRAEWGGLRLELADGTYRQFTLPHSLVFEDIAPRLSDLDNDGTPEVIVVESSLTAGSRLAVYGPKGRIAATPHIGTRNRWLAPIGAADLDGDGYVEVAYIDRPHLKQVLRVWRFRDGALHWVGDRQALTNHKIGWNFIPGGIRHCGEFPEIIVALFNWQLALAITYHDGEFFSVAVAAYPGPEDLNAALTCP